MLYRSVCCFMEKWSFLWVFWQICIYLLSCILQKLYTLYTYLPNEQSLRIQKQSRSRHPPYERLYFITFSMDCAGQKLITLKIKQSCQRKRGSRKTPMVPWDFTHERDSLLCNQFRLWNWQGQRAKCQPLHGAVCKPTITRQIKMDTSLCDKNSP